MLYQQIIKDTSFAHIAADNKLMNSAKAMLSSLTHPFAQVIMNNEQNTQLSDHMFVLGVVNDGF